jgi:hypothetical protein
VVELRRLKLRARHAVRCEPVSTPTFRLRRKPVFQQPSSSHADPATEDAAAVW